MFAPTHIRLCLYMCFIETFSNMPFINVTCVLHTNVKYICVYHVQTQIHAWNARCNTLCLFWCVQVTMHTITIKHYTFINNITQSHNLTCLCACTHISVLTQSKCVVQHSVFPYQAHMCWTYMCVCRNNVRNITSLIERNTSKFVKLRFECGCVGRPLCVKHQH